MAETWLPFLIKRPGPPGKLGYSGVTHRELSEVEGEVKHSTEGSLQAAFGVLDDPNRQSSWHGTLDTDGTGYQHYPLEAICWANGLAGDRRQDTSLIGNLTLLAWEHVDRIGASMLTTLTPAQVATTTRITEAVRALCPSVGAAPPTLRKNLWEHNWLSATACPSGLIPWTIIITALTEPEVNMDLNLLEVTGVSTFVVGVLGKRRLRTDLEVATYRKMGYGVIVVTQTEADSIPDAGLSGRLSV